MDTPEAVLEHFGIKGMKWGIRKDKASGPTSSDAQRAKEAQAIIKKHGVQALDNKDLQHLVTRMNLERQYSTTIAANPGKLKKGLGVAREVIGVGKTVQDAYNLVNSPMSKAVGKAIKENKSKVHAKSA